MTKSQGHPAEVQGHCEPKYARVKSFLQQMVNTGKEHGASICVNVAGKSVVDIWGGYKDAEKTQLWEKDTIVVCWSMTKLISSLAVLRLIDQKVLDSEARISQYWPEFSENGKNDVLLRHIMAHTAGLAGWDPPITSEEMYDVPYASRKLAGQAPLWKPGTAIGYHAVTQGHMMSELVQRVTGKSLKQYLVDEITRPLQADFQLGAPLEEWPRIAETIPPADYKSVQMDSSTVAGRAVNGTPMKPAHANMHHFRRAELAALNGFGNARSVVRILSAITLNGKVDDVVVLSPKTMRLVFEEQIEGMDVVIQQYFRWGMGFPLADRRTFDWLPEGKCVFFGGWGGSVAIMDVDSRMTISYTMSRMAPMAQPWDLTESYVREIYAAFNDN